MSSIDQMLQARGRAVQNRVQGRLVTYQPPDGDGSIVADLVVVYGSAEDVAYDTHDGQMVRRELVVRVNVSDSAGVAAKLVKGGSFLLDADNAGRASAWSIESFPNSEDGWRRCLCVRVERQGGRHGMPRVVR